MSSAGAVSLLNTQARGEQFGIDGLVDVTGLTIKGFTFTGQLKNIDLLKIKSVAIQVSAPGKGVVFDDCVFTELQATSIFSLRRSSLTLEEDYPVDSGAVTLQNSYFKNVKYSRNALATNGNSALTVEDCVFENVEFTPANELDPQFIDGHFFVCNTADFCAVKDSCHSGVTWGQSLFQQAIWDSAVQGGRPELDGTEFVIENSYGGEGNKIVDLGLFHTDSNDIVEKCAAGFAVSDVSANTTPSWTPVSCTTPSFDAATCPSNAGSKNVCLYPFWSQILPFLCE